MSALKRGGFSHNHSVLLIRALKKVRHAIILDKRKLHAFWERDHLRKLFDYLRADCVFDIGASTGQYASTLRKEVGFSGYIFSFEPNPEVAVIARDKAGNDDKWLVFNTAIADKNDKQELNIMRDSQFSSLSFPRHDECDFFVRSNTIRRVIEVRTEMLSTIFHRLQSQYHFQRPFLKMDTQGFDVTIVKSSEDVIREFVGLQSELSIVKLYDSSVDFREAISEYQRQGFTLSALVPNNAGHFPRLVEIDCVMVRSDLLDVERKSSVIV